MQAMILAAGRGTRMLPLTNKIPKALAIFNNKPLIEHLIINLKNNGINQIVINLHHLGEQIKQYLKNGHKYGVSISYSEETTLLDTGGGIVQALTKGLLKQEPFIVISTDIVTNFNFKFLFSKLFKLAHLILVPNPSYHPHGDFSLNNNNLQLPLADANLNYTYANIGIFDPKFFNNPPGTIFPLGAFFKQAIINQQITGEIYNGLWKNIGTIAELTTSIN
jgi:N-acetyl-alpha-D-muramate 1-phosphate uridylyltransferase